MFGSKTALGIDVSETLINLALVKRTKDGIKLLKSVSGPVPEGTIENGNVECPAILAKAIMTLKTKNRIYAPREAFAVVANPMLMQILDLPKNVPDNIRGFIQDEVKHYAILPIKNTAIDFCGIRSSSRSGNARAFVVATDGQRINKSARALNREGLNVKAIEPALVAYIRSCYAKRIAEKFDRNLLFVIVHEGILSLCVFKNQTLDFVRIKRLKSNEREVEEYYVRLAEEINAVLRFYGLEVHEAVDKWEVTVVESICDKPVEEKAASLEAKLEAVSSIELEVRTLEEAYLDSPVSDTKQSTKPSAIAVGLAMKLLGFPSCGLNVNLLPPRVAEIKTVQKQTLVSANIAAAIIFLMILSVGFFNTKVEKVKASIEQKQQTKLAQDTQVLVSNRATLNKQIANVSANIKRMDAVLSAGSFLRWGQILDDIRIAIPKNARITKLTSNGNSKMLIEGQSLSYESIHFFVDTLNNCENIESASLIGTYKDSKSKDLLRYSINCLLIQ